MKHRARKRFGQNFLQDNTIITSILRAFNAKSQQNIIEIGPGLGALTKPLLETLDKLTVIEIDRDLQAFLPTLPHAKQKLHIIGSDALSIDYSSFGYHLRIIGNLPYNISTPLLIHLLQFTPYIEEMYFMLQKEVVERIVATPGSKKYGRLSVIVQYFCEVDALFNVPAHAFEPKPQVESAMLRISPYKISPYPTIPFKQLEKFVASAFAMRRKTLANNLKPYLSAQDLINLGIDPTQRPEQLSVADYVQLAKFVIN